MIETISAGPDAGLEAGVKPKPKLKPKVKASAKPPQPGLRERSKQERQERITLAARRLFAERGYDAATLREIAAEAGLGLGTLFNYISDKRDLIYLIFNHEFETLTTKALAAPKPWQSLRGKLMSLMELHYRLLAEEPVLSRILLSEVLLQTPGMHLERWRASRLRLIGGIRDMVASAQAAGEIGSGEDPERIARLIFFLFSSALRWWLATPQPEWREGVRELGRLLDMLMRGAGQPEADGNVVAASPTGEPPPSVQAGRDGGE